MPIFDYECEKCGKVETDVFLSVHELAATQTRPCSKCSSGVARRLFPIPSRPIVGWASPVWSWRHGKAVRSMKHGDALDKESHEPNMEKKAMQYAQEDARMAQMMEPKE